MIMKLGKLFKAVVKTATLPIAIGADVITMGASKATDGKFFVEKQIENIADDLDEVTD